MVGMSYLENETLCILISGKGNLNFVTNLKIFDAYIQKQNVSLIGWISSLDMVTERYVLCTGMVFKFLCYMCIHTVKS